MQSELKNHLEKQLEHINTSLSFAEAKNIALIAFNVAMMSLLNDLYTENKIFFCITLLFIVTSSLVSILSFRPNLSSRAKKNKDNSNNMHESNLIFFGNIAKIDNENSFLKYTAKRYFSKTNFDNFDNILIDLASEILINSKITYKKNIYFKNALILDVVCLLFMIGILLIA